MSDRVVLLFTKPARPGRVKTRLIGELTAEEASHLHAAFVGDLLDRLRGGDFELRLAWALESLEPIPESVLASVRQHGDDLGERLYGALSSAAREARCVAAIGSDHPELTRADLEKAFEVLESGTVDVVLGPAIDGGYYVVAMHGRAVHERLFEDIPWSTATVLADTVDRCESLGLRTHLLPPASDVDTPADLDRLTAALAEGTIEAPLTAGLLRSWGRLSDCLSGKDTG